MEDVSILFYRMFPKRLCFQATDGIQMLHPILRTSTLLTFQVHFIGMQWDGP